MKYGQFFKCINDDFPTHYTDIDCIIITGSRYDAHQQTPWMIKILKEIKKLINHKSIKIVGICFGHQLLSFLHGYSARSINSC